jgi:hypothetical protein
MPTSRAFIVDHRNVLDALVSRRAQTVRCRPRGDDDLTRRVIEKCLTARESSRRTWHRRHEPGEVAIVHD